MIELTCRPRFGMVRPCPSNLHLRHCIVYDTMSVEIESYEDTSGARPFDRWFDRLPAAHAAKVTAALVRIGLGARSGLKAVGSGECQNGGSIGDPAFGSTWPSMEQGSLSCWAEEPRPVSSPILKKRFCAGLTTSAARPRRSEEDGTVSQLQGKP